MLRSWLFVPGDSERKLSHALEVGADAVILDLEDAVTPQRQPIARTLVAGFLRAHPTRDRPQVWVRINPLVTAAAREDLAAVLPARPDGIVLPKTAGPGEPAPDFVVQGPGAHRIPGLANLFGIESPGLTASLALAAMVLEELR